MDENYIIKTRQTRQLLAELHRISGIETKIDSCTTNNLYNVTSDSSEMGSQLDDRSYSMLLCDKKLTGLIELESAKHKVRNQSGKLTLKQARLDRVIDNECPIGLQSLLSVNSLFVDQETETLGAIAGIETDVRYVIRDVDGKRLFFAVEQSSIMTKLCLCSRRPFNALIFNDDQKHIMNIRRPYKCHFEKAYISAPPDVYIGSIEEKITCMGHLFLVKDALGNIIQQLRSAACAISRCHQVDFDVLSPDDQIKIGEISNEWGGFGGEQATVDSQCLGIFFPEDLKCQSKALLLGALLTLNITLYGT